MKSNDADATLRALAARARAESSDVLSDERWDAVAAGRATQADREALERACREAGLDAEAAALFHPIDPKGRGRAVAGALAALEEGAQTSSDPAAGAPPAPAAREARVLSLPRRIAPLVGALALAAGVALFFASRGGQDTFGPVPGYEMTVEGGVADKRGEPPGTIVLAPRSRVVLTLRPATRVEGKVEARAHLVRDGRALALPLDATVMQEGAVRLTGSVGEIAVPDGPAELVVTIVRPGATHDPLGGSSDRAQVMRRAVVISREAR